MTSHQGISSENYAAKHDKCHKDISQRQETKTSLTQISSRDKILQQKPCDDLMISSRHLISTEKAGNLSRNSHYGTQKTSNLITQLSSTTQHKVIRKSHNHPKAWSLMRKISWHFITPKKHKSLYGNLITVQQKATSTKEILHENWAAEYI